MGGDAVEIVESAVDGGEDFSNQKFIQIGG
jgi:hypothetical protein